MNTIHSQAAEFYILLIVSFATANLRAAIIHPLVFPTDTSALGVAGKRERGVEVPVQQGRSDR